MSIHIFSNGIQRTRNCADQLLARDEKIRVLVLVCFFLTATTFANPGVMTVVSGQAAPPVTTGSQMTVTTTTRATVLNWSSFNIDPGETTTFVQPSATSVVINNIGDTKPSQVWGNLNANGSVILVNGYGFSFGPNSMIKIGGSFIATTAALRPDLGADGVWQFTGPPPAATIKNYGQVQVGNGQSLYLIAADVENYGTLTAPGGDIGLHAGQEVLLNERADGRGFSAIVRLPTGSVDNEGNIIADAGTIALQAQVVNQNGVIQANSVKNQNGIIELVASDTLTLGANSAISALGDTSSVSEGGFVIAKSEKTFTDNAGSTVTVSGNGGAKDGIIEIFGNGVTAGSVLSSFDNLSASQFGAHDILLVNPFDINLSTATTSTSITSGANSTFKVTDLAGYAQIALFASDNIELKTAWTLTDPGVPASLTLQAGNNVIIDTASSLIARNNWTINLAAGSSSLATSPTLSLTPAAGGAGIYLNGTAFITSQNGDVNLVAAGDLEVNSGYINTTAGGNIFARSVFGDVNAGVNNIGYSITTAGLTPVINTSGIAQAGGISTLSGGNVTLDAGANVISPTATTVASGDTPAASGAHANGNVTIAAGNNIVGSFLVANGTGLLESGVNVQKDATTGVYDVTINPGQTTADIGGLYKGTPLNPVTLSLISGSWNAFAARDIYLTEVNNPNGTYDGNRLTVPANTYSGNEDVSGNITTVPAKSTFLFNYASDSSASFWAGDAINLGVGNLFRTTTGVVPTPIYPPSLSLEAGAGGITFDKSVILAPSSEGTLDITTHDGGGLKGLFIQGAGIGTGLTMSDSGLPGWSTFASGHAVTPVHSTDADGLVNQVNMDISGGINTFNLVVPTAATVSAASAYNFGFSGQNLSTSAKTSIAIAGDLTYRGDVTTINLSDYSAGPFPAEFFDVSTSSDPAVTANLVYNAATGQLSYLGKISTIGSTSDLNFLLNPTTTVTDANGNTQTVAIPLTTQQVAAINALSGLSQTAVADSNGSGLSLNGPGQFSISAHTIDLGISSGIQVNKTLVPQLTAISLLGASLDVTLTGNLEMTSTRIINSGWLGGIDLNVAGTIDVGQQSGVLGDPNASRGIYTSGGGNVTVTSGGDVNVDGSRIATYDGGNLVVISTQGDVNAGSGGNGAVNIDSVIEKGADGKLVNLASLPLYNGSVPIYGSGLMATTPAGSAVSVGNITVKALAGNINANAGGIEQIAFNEMVSPDAFIELDAGHDILAGNSGVIGKNILPTGDNVSGIFVGSGSVNVKARHNFSGTIVGAKGVSVNAGGLVTGTIVGGDSISVTGSDITASLISDSVSTSGDASSAAIGAPKSNVAPEDAKVAEDASTTAATNGPANEDDELKKRGAANQRIVKLLGRVTVILPSGK